MSVEKPALLRKSFSAVKDLIETGKVRIAKPIRAYKLSQIEITFRSMQSGRNAEAIVMSFTEMKR